MRGTYFLGNGAFETRDMPEHPLAPREVLIQVAARGVCGTDVHIYHGDKGSAEVIPPVVLGHELSGTVAAVGAAGMFLWLSESLMMLARMGGQVITAAAAKSSSARTSTPSA